jgi:DNA-binding MarR family transcriptional regulator
MVPGHSEIYTSVGKVHRVLQSAIQSAVVGFDLTVAQFHLLAIVASGKEDSPARCSEAINLTPSGMTNVLDSLESRGLVGRVRDRSDRRFVTIRLSHAGNLLYQQASAQASKAWDKAVQDLSGDVSVMSSMFSAAGSN